MRIMLAAILATTAIACAPVAAPQTINPPAQMGQVSPTMPNRTIGEQMTIRAQVNSIGDNIILMQSAMHHQSANHNDWSLWLDNIRLGAHVVNNSLITINNAEDVDLLTRGQRHIAFVVVACDLRSAVVVGFMDVPGIGRRDFYTGWSNSDQRWRWYVDYQSTEPSHLLMPVQPYVVAPYCGGGELRSIERPAPRVAPFTLGYLGSGGSLRGTWIWTPSHQRHFSLSIWDGAVLRVIVEDGEPL